MSCSGLCVSSLRGMGEQIGFWALMCVFWGPLMPSPSPSHAVREQRPASGSRRRPGDVAEKNEGCVCCLYNISRRRKGLCWEKKKRALQKRRKQREFRIIINARVSAALTPRCATHTCRRACRHRIHRRQVCVAHRVVELPTEIHTHTCMSGFAERSPPLKKQLALSVSTTTR